ncbi:MAG: amidohydrolase, partial [Nitrospirales bacterium]|nr:amidohydrolase [Nitrospirales bacterium]
QAIEWEIADLDGFAQLAASIEHNAKGKALLKALGIAFTKARTLGSAEKAIIFTESRRTQMYLKDWLENYIWPAEGKWLGPEFISDAIELACLEMIRGGVTTYNDMYFFGDSAAEATKRMGLRAVLGVGILDFPSASARNTDEYLANAETFVRNWQSDGLITPCIAPHAIYTCGPETLKRSKALAERLGSRLHIHLSETEWEIGESLVRFQKRPVEHLESLGFLDETVLAAHCVWLEDNEIEIMAKRRVGVSHCMESNLKLASGFAPVVTMLMAGVKVSFGTDGAASNNDLNVLSEVSTTAKVHKALSSTPTVMDAKTALLMATRWGAEVLGLGDRIGSLEAGKEADIITIDLRKPHLVPLYDVYSHIVYSAMASDVDSVMVKGRLLMDKRELVSADQETIMAKAVEWGKKIAGA